MKVLALGAHPDDIEIYMFGTLAAFAARGDQLAFGIATDGAQGGFTDPAELRKTRKDEALAAARLLMVEPRFLDFADSYLTSDAALIDALKSLIAEFGPELIITHAPNDYHGDHRALSDAVRIAASFSAPVVHADNFQGVGFTPSYYVDISAFMELKLTAIRAHASQSTERLVAMVQRLNAFRAAQAGSPDGSYAEAFRFEPVFPFVDIRDLLPPAPKVRSIG
jgi:LmbE family N-acetylglucosaminyl deacetylase